MSTSTTFSCFFPARLLGKQFSTPRDAKLFFRKIATWVINTSGIFTLKCALRDFLTATQAFLIYCCEIELFKPSRRTALVVDKFFVKFQSTRIWQVPLFSHARFSVNKGIHWSMQIPSYRTSNIALPLGWTANHCRHFRSKWDIKIRI